MSKFPVQRKRKGAAWIQKNGNRWYARWRSYERVDGVERAVPHCKSIDRVDEITEDDARLAAAKFAERHRVILNLGAGDQNEGRGTAIAELSIAVDLMRQGYEVFQALSPQAPCDLLAMHGSTILRVECKKTDLDANGRSRRDIRQKVGKFDVLAILTSSGAVVYQDHNEAFGNTATELHTRSKNLARNSMKMVRPAGFEPATFCSGGKRSIHLSYGRILV